MKREFKVGDRVSTEIEQSGRVVKLKGKVVSYGPAGFVELDADVDGTIYVLPSTLRRIKIWKPRDFWINTYEFDQPTIHESKAEADRASSDAWRVCSESFEVREVRRK